MVFGIDDLAAVSAVTSLAGTASSVGGKLKGGQAQRTANDSAAAAAAAQAAYQAQVSRNNAIIAEQNADYAIKAGQQKAAVQSMRGAATQGSIKAGQAASGVDVNTGSAVDVRQGQREAAVLDSETVLHKGQLEAYGYRTQATQFEAEAQLQDAKASFARQSIGAGGDYGSTLAAGGSLLSSASALPWKWLTGSGSGSGYDLASDTARTQNDADLGGYGSSA